MASPERVDGLSTVKTGKGGQPVHQWTGTFEQMARPKRVDSLSAVKPKRVDSGHAVHHATEKRSLEWFRDSSMDRDLKKDDPIL